MALLTQVLRFRAVDSDGRDAGRLDDLVADIDQGTPVVRHAMLRSGPDLRRADIADIDPDREIITVVPTGDHCRRRDLDDLLEPTEIALARDVLDCQAVDIKGRRLARVADVVLDLAQDGTPAVVRGVDIGTGALLRRILGRAAPHRPAGPRDVIPWGELHLASARGHAAQIEAPSSVIHHLDDRELAEVVARIPVHRASDLLHRLPLPAAAGALHHSHPATRERILRHLHHDAHDDLIAATAARGHTVAFDRPAPRRFKRLRGWRREVPEDGPGTPVADDPGPRR